MQQNFNNLSSKSSWHLKVTEMSKLRTVATNSYKLNMFSSKRLVCAQNRTFTVRSPGYLCDISEACTFSSKTSTLLKLSVLTCFIQTAFQSDLADSKVGQLYLIFNNPDTIRDTLRTYTNQSRHRKFVQ